MKLRKLLKNIIVISMISTLAFGMVSCGSKKEELSNT